MNAPIDNTQNWQTLRSTHQVVCAECETIISCLEQERESLRVERTRLKMEKERLQHLLDEAKRYGYLGPDAPIYKSRDRYRGLAERMAEAGRELLHHTHCEEMDSYPKGGRELHDALAAYDSAREE